MASSKRKKKNLFTLIALCLVIGIMVGAYFIIQDRNDKKAAAEEEEATAEEAASNTTAEIFTLTADDVVEISFLNSTWEATVIKSEEVYSLKDNADFPLDQTKAGYIFDYIDTAASKIVNEAPTDLAEFGLDTPQITITAVDSTGASYILYIGDESGSGVGYYARIEGSNTVYVVPVSLYTYYAYTESELIAMETTPTIATDYVRKLAITSEEFGNLTLNYAETAPSAYAGMALNNWSITEPYEFEIECDATAVSEMIANYATFTLDSAVDYKKENWADYGLETPASKLDIIFYYAVDAAGNVVDTTTDTTTEVSYVPSEYILYIGDKNENGDYFVRQEGSNNVYLMAAANVTKLLDVDAFSLVNKYIDLIAIKTLTKMEVSYGDKLRTFEMLYEMVENDEGVLEEDEAGFIADGITLTDDEAFRSMYQVLIGAQLVDFLPKDAVVGTEAALTVHYYRTTEEFTEVVIEYFPYNDNYYAVSINGELKYTIDARDVTEMINSVDSFVAE